MSSVSTFPTLMFANVWFSRPMSLTKLLLFVGGGP